jgi:predicted RNA binding protein YcfA (HicA-like mRNA interferase family)
MPKLPGVGQRAAIAALQKAGFQIIRQGKHVVMSNGIRTLTIPRHDPINAYTMGTLPSRPVSPPTNFGDSFDPPAFQAHPPSSILALVPKVNLETKLRPPSSARQSFRVPRQRGNPGQPQNSDPAFAPRRAVRLTIAALHDGQCGATVETPISCLAADA